MIARWILAAAAALLLAALAAGSGPAPGRAAASDTAIFAGGCFWCMEAAFDEVDGVTETISGYAGGTKPNPTYGDHEGYLEAVKVTYDPAKVTYAKLLDHYWQNIDPFDPDGQFCDKGPAYHSAIFFGNDEEKKLAETTKQEIAARFKQTVATEIKPIDHLHGGRGLPPGLSQPESGELQVLQMGLRPGAAARRDLGQAAFVMRMHPNTPHHRS